MTVQHLPAIVAIFRVPEGALRAVNELQSAGFRGDQIGIAGRELGLEAKHLDTAHGAAAPADNNVSAAKGVGLGALIGLGLMVLSLPAIGPVWTAGTLAVLIGNAAAGGAVGGLLAALVSRGISEEEAHTIASELAAGQTLVSVETDSRAAEAWEILERHGGIGASDPLHSSPGRSTKQQD
jgi:hypothetical protein